MTKEEALQIPDLCINVDAETEDCFYMVMADERLIPMDYKEKAIQRLSSVGPEVSLKSLEKAVKMVENVRKYGIACAEWV